MLPSRAAGRAYDVVVVGLGLAGLVAGLAAALAGARTLVVGKGFGSTHFRTGGIDVLGYADGHHVRAPAEELGAFRAAHPGHPYAVAGPRLGAALEMVRAMAAASGLELIGDLGTNRLVATATGTLRPSCLVPASMNAAWDGAHVLAVGFDSYRDFSAPFFAAGLPRAGAALGMDLRVRPLTLDLPELRRRHLAGPELARLLDQPGFRALLARELEPHVRGVTHVALPATLGLDRCAEAAQDLERRLGVRAVEVPTLPPSIPGMRLARALEAGLRGAGARVQVGTAVRLRPRDGRVEWLELESAAHPQRFSVGAVVLATGGLLGGGLALEGPDRVVETVGALPVELPAGGPEEWFSARFLEPGGHGYARMGVRVADHLRPLGEGGEPVASNLYAAGGLLAGAQRAVEKSADGIACATGLMAGEEAA
ncbi:MAG: anaerobic glycerol-3-phosphate dehydrogenase subunit GlpB [Candidatus Dormibacteraceae bacterium]